MATVAADQAANLLNNLSLDQSKTLEASEPVNKPSVDSEVNGTGQSQSQSLDRSLTPVIPDIMDPAVAYFPAYYYGGYDGAANDYSRFLNFDGVDTSQGVYGENGSVMYPGYGYAPYGPYSPAGSPVPTTGHDGQLYGAQQYQYPSPYFQPVAQTNAPSKVDFTRSAVPGEPSFTVDTTASGITKGNTGAASVRPVANQNPVFSSSGSYDSGSQNVFQDPIYRFDGVHSPIPWLDGTVYSNGQHRSNTNSVPLSSANGFASKNQNIGSHSHLVSPRPLSAVNTASGYMNRVYPNKLYGQYQGAYGSGFGYGSNSYGSQNRQGWLTLDNKYRSRGRGNGIFNYYNENSDGLSELNRGPRARITKNQKVPTRVTVTTKGQNDNLPDTVEKITLFAAPDREQYNREEFPETFTDAKFFVIKSYSEDDVHKSVKYNVWSSTQNGNKKLDAAYQEAQHKPDKCPVFLFFSVNTSGQFVGVAEMVGPVDFNKSLDYWQQDKWVGYFPVKWHIVKDVPNSMLKHIILEYNENKPVTNSRDTQEVKLEQGLQMIKIFKDHSSKRCILDDFEFYEERQKRIQEKKAKQQFQKQAWEEKPTLVEKNKEEVPAPDLVKEEVKHTDNVSFDKAI
ncbi:putative YTH domain-containing protein [Helianthus annuus]|uniref:YTH domain-containing family protein n=1 Tax=Helianthus annuus TaxID=4232 RepID=A0A9K3IIG0_HELAN|nr:YTH domain-containing protein ECT4 isoform X2 [Helianthus annuus]KAF5797387.1 putative YTH domain-containing protein [Helianthus annuus]KAJ0549144.1 putative YTH domain-containing protein [Helianthus annuus]KAJ0555390.1 putative YTH domain-containing protein [Helianthus annuus]KAJ0562091.1 putative YTH domain-containing protein [Helianthus annuus]KAJ0730263.1 putative YTH domain-containing protein [Helianthus annuus]